MLKVRKNDPTKFKPIRAKAGVPSEQLNRVRVVRKTTDRDKFQYKIIFPSGKEMQFKNFAEVRYFVNLNLRQPPAFLEIEREGGITRVDFSTFQNEGRNDAGCVC